MIGYGNGGEARRARDREQLVDGVIAVLAEAGVCMKIDGLHPGWGPAGDPAYFQFLSVWGSFTCRSAEGSQAGREVYHYIGSRSAGDCRLRCRYFQHPDDLSLFDEVAFFNEVRRKMGISRDEVVAMFDVDGIPESERYTEAITRPSIEALTGIPRCAGISMPEWNRPFLSPRPDEMHLTFSMGQMNSSSEVSTANRLTPLTESFSMCSVNRE